jgi:hypothetical protein
VSSRGWSAVHFAVIGGFRDICSFLVAQGVDFARTDVAGNGIMQLVAQYRRPWAADVLRGTS